MPSIPVTSPFGYLGVLLFIVGGFLLLSGMNVIRIEKITIQSGRNTILSSVLIILVGFVFLFLDSQGKQPVTLDAATTSESVPTQVEATSETPVSLSAVLPTEVIVPSKTAAPTITNTPAFTPEPEQTSTATPTQDISQYRNFYCSSLDDTFFAVVSEISGRYRDDPYNIMIKLDPFRLYINDQIDEQYQTPREISQVYFELKYSWDGSWATVGESNRFQINQWVFPGSNIELPASEFTFAKKDMANDREYQLLFTIKNTQGGYYFIHCEDTFVFDYSWDYVWGTNQFDERVFRAATTVEPSDDRLTAEIHGTYKMDSNAVGVEVEGGKVSYLLKEGSGNQPIKIDYIDVHYEYWDSNDEELTISDNSNIYPFNVDIQLGESLIIPPYNFLLYNVDFYSWNTPCSLVFDFHLSTGEHFYIRSEEPIDFQN